MLSRAGWTLFGDGGHASARCSVEICHRQGISAAEPFFGWKSENRAADPGSHRRPMNLLAESPPAAGSVRGPRAWVAGVSPGLGESPLSARLDQDRTAAPDRAGEVGVLSEALPAPPGPRMSCEERGQIPF